MQIPTPIQRISSFIGQFFVVFVVVSTLWSWQNPTAFAWAGDKIPFLLGILMFGAGSTLTFEEFKDVARHPLHVVAAVAAQYIMMPLLAFLLVELVDLPDTIAFGVILVGACPGGIASNVITLMAKGDVALSVSITSVSTLLSPIMTPLIVILLTGSDIDVQPLSLLSSIVMIIIFPISMGLIARMIFGQNLTDVMKVLLPVMTTFSIMSLTGATVGANKDVIASVSITILFVVMAHNVLGYLGGYGVARLVGLPSRQRKSFCFEIGMQNSSLAVALATLHFAPAAAVAAAIFGVWHNVSGPALASLWTWRDAGKANSRPNSVNFNS
ncbi:bile acid:sodium symporter family protein [Ruegeria jejuensis]|uniref:bile acid:sodium symporter family protein n=1 Tax=Ruegeria jejuensis TaxID=3233338 RepID=UPI00355B0E76